MTATARALREVEKLLNARAGMARTMCRVEAFTAATRMVRELRKKKS